MAGKKKNKAIKPIAKIIETDETYIGKPRKYNKRAVKMINHIAKTASSYSSSGACSGTGFSGRGGDVANGMPSFYDPYFEPSTLVLPRDILEINSWCRYFYKYDPYVATAVDMHAELPLSKMRLMPPKSKDKRRSQMILSFFEDMIGNDGLDLYGKLLQIGVEYYKLGNVYPYLQLNEEQTKWEKLTLLDPDYIYLEKLQYTNAIKIELIPNDRLKQIITRGDGDENTGMLSQTLSPVVKDHVLAGKNVPLSAKTTESHVSHIARKMGDYEILGTSLIERNFKALVYKDRLRRSQDAIAVRHLTPKHLISTDNTANNVDVEEIREQVDNALQDPDYAIITNFQLSWELVGTNQGLMQLSSEWEWINEELMLGLMLNKSFVMGEGAFANGQTVLEVLEQRYAIFRGILEDWCETHVFKPIAVLNDFTETKRAYVRNEEGKVVEDDVEVVLYPKIKWNRLNLTDDNQHKQMLAQMVERGFLDVETWLEYFGLDASLIGEKLKKFENTPLDPNYQELQRTIQGEIGRVLGPAMAKVRAEEMGLELATEGEDGGRFGSGYAKGMTKDGSVPIRHTDKPVEGIDDLPQTTKNLYSNIVNELTNKMLNKMSETTEERRVDRSTRSREREHEDAVRNLTVEDKKQRILPNRKDVSNRKTPDMFAENYVDFVKESDIVKKNSINPEATQDSLTYSPVENEF